LLVLVLMLSLNFGVFPAFGQATPKIFVEPKDNIFSTETTVVGDTFTVNISTSGWELPGLYAYEFKLHYDPTLLNITKAGYPTDHFLSKENNFPTPVIIDYEAGYALYGCVLLADVPGSTGSGVFAYATFQIIKAPPLAGTVSCDLTIDGITFLDPDGNSMESDVEHGYYEFAAPRPPIPQLKVEPDYVTAKEVGDQFTIDIMIQDVYEDYRIVGIEWRLHFNTSILEVLNIEEGDYLKSEAAAAATETGEDYGTYFHAIPPEPPNDYVISFTLNYRYPWPPTIFPGHYSHGGSLATLTFNATYKPTFLDIIASCDLLLTDILVIDVNGNEVETKPPLSGKYEISIATPPWLSVDPKKYTASELGKEFDLTILINELEADWKMVGAEFKIRYNLTLLELTNIVEGGFMKHFAMLSGASAPYTWFQYYVEEDPTSGYGIVGILILPLENGTWPGPFPDTEDYGAPGDLAIPTFKAIHQHEELDLTCDIWLDEIVLVNTAGTEMPYNATVTAEEGICKYTILKAKIPFMGILDLMTQYPDPWNGRGEDAASDAFPPQGVVALKAYVTYQGDVVPSKPVSYAIRSPNGDVYYATNFTEADGIAVFEYSLPGSEDHFGLWTVDASVDLAGTIVSDTLYFLMGWLVQVVNVEAPETTYKGETMDANITLARICMQDPKAIMNMLLKDSDGNPITDNDLLLYITVTDELKQPVATSKLNTSIITEISGIDLDDFVETIGEQWLDHLAIISTQYPELTDVVMNGIPISPAAYSGEATIRVNLLTDFPGVAYCPEGIGRVWIRKGP